MPNVTTYTVRIECTCTACKALAARVGAPFPLAAMVTPTSNIRTATQRHGAVSAAHHPTIGRMQRLAVAVTA